MTKIYLKRGEPIRFEITAQTDGENIALDETWTVAAWMREKKCGATAFDLSPVIAGGIVEIDRTTADLTASTYEFDIRFADADGNIFSEIMELNISSTVTPAT